MSTKYVVLVSEFAKKYYLKNFRKRYKATFDVPWRAYLLMLQKFDLMIERSNTTAITDESDDVVIYKSEFKISPTESARKAGNRCIIALNKEKLEAHILLVYCKNDIRGQNETVWWKGIVRENYPKYGKMLS